jgi:hypothetical protein
VAQGGQVRASGCRGQAGQAARVGPADGQPAGQPKAAVNLAGTEARAGEVVVTEEVSALAQAVELGQRQVDARLTQTKLLHAVGVAQPHRCQGRSLSAARQGPRLRAARCARARAVQVGSLGGGKQQCRQCNTTSQTSFRHHVLLGECPAAAGLGVRGST